VSETPEQPPETAAADPAVDDEAFPGGVGDGDVNDLPEADMGAQP
jgi:hypothetical protein